MRLIKRGQLYYLEARIKPSPDQPVQRHRISTGCTDKQDAERAAADLHKKLLEGAHSWRRSVPTMAEWWATFHAAAEGRVSKITYLDWTSKQKKLITAFGKMRLNAITTGHCEQYRDELLKTYKPGTVRVHMLLLMNVLNAARKAKHITESPARGVELPQNGRRRRILAPDEQHKLITTLQSETESGSEYVRLRAIQLRNLLVVALGTGLRIGTIAKRLGKSSLVKSADGAAMIEIRTKGDKLHRLPVVPEVEAALASQAQLTAHKDWLFDAEPERLRDQIHALRERADVAHFTPHDLRRTFCTRLALGDARLGIAPVPLAVLKELMGHSTVAITHDFYTVAETDAVKASFLKGAAGALGLGTGMAPKAAGTDTGTPA